MTQDILLGVTALNRPSARIRVQPETRPDPSIDDVVEMARRHAGADAWTISGGEPTLRPDLPQLLTRLSEAGAPRLGLRTDALALDEPRRLEILKRAGLRRLRILFNSARPDAHDFIAGLPGAARAAHRAMKTAVSMGIELEADVQLTRPTTPHLEETITLLAHLGARRVHVHPPALEQLKDADFTALAPRFGLAQPYLEAAVRAAGERGLEIRLYDLPLCGLGEAASAALTSVAGREDQSERARCASCPGAAACGGVSASYVARFGWNELESERCDRLAPAREGDARTVGAVAIAPPPPRAGRAPSTRVAFAVRQSSRRLEGDPLAGVPTGDVPDALRVRFDAPSRVFCPTCGDAPGAAARPEPTREIRKRLVRAAQQGPSILRIASAGSLAHPQAPELLREATRLSFRRVEAAGEASALAEWTPSAMARLIGLTRLDAALYGPDADAHDTHCGRTGAFAATLAGLGRLTEIASVPTGVYGVLHDATAVSTYAAAWTRGALPGTPQFRLSPDGSSLETLAAAVAALPAGDAQNALAPLLPLCLRPAGAAVPESPREIENEWEHGHAAPRSPSGSDRNGEYDPCARRAACAASDRCPGVPRGWTVEDAALTPVAEATA